MRTPATTRVVCWLATALCLATAAAPGMQAQQRAGGGFHAQPMPAQMAQAPQNRAPQPAGRPQGNPGNQEHLGQWMAHHSNLTPQQQQRALEQEPGFRQLPPQTQQRMRDRLNQLNAMAPGQRSHMLERAEEMEHLSPPQRQQVRSAMSQLGSLPPDRRRMVARAFRDLREMPPEQRQGALNSEQFRNAFSPEERGTLSNLLTVEPLLPPQHSQEASPGLPQH